MYIPSSNSNRLDFTMRRGILASATQLLRGLSYVLFKLVLNACLRIEWQEQTSSRLPPLSKFVLFYCNIITFESRGRLLKVDANFASKNRFVHCGQYTMAFVSCRFALSHSLRVRNQICSMPNTLAGQRIVKLKALSFLIINNQLLSKSLLWRRQLRSPILTKHLKQDGGK